MTHDEVFSLQVALDGFDRPLDDAEQRRLTDATWNMPRAEAMVWARAEVVKTLRAALATFEVDD